MNAAAQLAVIAGIAVAGAAGSFFVGGAPGRTLVCDPALLKPDEVCLAQVTGEVLWIDARRRSEWQASGLEGSILWNMDPAEDAPAMEAEAVARILEMPDVVIYCGDENCGLSRQIATKVHGLGLDARVRVLHGGWRALAEAGKVRRSSPSVSSR